MSWIGVEFQMLDGDWWSLLFNEFVCRCRASVSFLITCGSPKLSDSLWEANISQARNSNVALLQCWHYSIYSSYLLTLLYIHLCFPPGWVAASIMYFIILSFYLLSFHFILSSLVWACDGFEKQMSPSSTYCSSLQRKRKLSINNVRSSAL